MQSELNGLLNSIKEQTGIDVTIYSEVMNFYVSTNSMPQEELSFGTDFEGITQDEKTQKTYFKVNYKKGALSGVIDGTDKRAYNYAYFISNLIENFSGKELQLNQHDYLKTILLGHCNSSQIQRFIRKFNVPVAVMSCVLLIKVKNAKKDDVFNFLTNYTNNTADIPVFMEDGYYALVKFIDELNDSEYQSVTDYAEYLHQSLYEETGVSALISVGGTAKNFSEIYNSYNQAITVMTTVENMNLKTSVHSYKEVVYIKMFEDLPRYKLNEYSQILLDSNAGVIFSDEEMINTAEEFLNNNLNASETSRRLYLHRNTLTYRLDKIEKNTGLNIRKFSDALTFRMITVIMKILK